MRIRDASIYRVALQVGALIGAWIALLARIARGRRQESASGGSETPLVMLISLQTPDSHPWAS